MSVGSFDGYLGDFFVDVIMFCEIFGVLKRLSGDSGSIENTVHALDCLTEIPSDSLMLFVLHLSFGTCEHLILLVQFHVIAILV